MLLLQTLVFHVPDIRSFNEASGVIIPYAELQPNRPGFQLEGFLNDWHNLLSPHEYVNNIDSLRYIEERLVGFFSQYFGVTGVDRDDPVALLLQVSGHAVTRLSLFRRQAHYGYHTRCFQKFFHLIIE